MDNHPKDLASKQQEYVGLGPIPASTPIPMPLPPKDSVTAQPRPTLSEEEAKELNSFKL